MRQPATAVILVPLSGITDHRPSHRLHTGAAGTRWWPVGRLGGNFQWHSTTQWLPAGLLLQLLLGKESGVEGYRVTKGLRLQYV